MRCCTLCAGLVMTREPAAAPRLDVDQRQGQQGVRLSIQVQPVEGIET